MGKRFKDADWDLANSQGNIDTWEKVQIAVLMDIRDEMRRMNAILHCHNFLEIPGVLRAIRRNTTKKKKQILRPKLKAVA